MSGISKKRLRRYMDMLEKEGMIGRQKTNKYSLISIVNYNQYQIEGSQEAAKGQAKGKPRASQGQHRKKGKNDKEKDIPPISPKGDDVDFSVWPQQPTDQTMKDWQAMRKKKKATISQTVVNRMTAELEKAVSKGYTVDECLQECVLRNWQGFKVEWMQNSAFGNQPTQPQRKQPKDFDFGS